MISRKGAVLVVGGSGLLTLGSLVFAALWVTPLLTSQSQGGSVPVYFLGTEFQINPGPLPAWIEQHDYVLGVLAEVTAWLGKGGAFFLGVALLRPGLNSLVRGQTSASAGTIRWLAILGLLSTFLAVVGQVTPALLEQIVGIPLSESIFLLLVKIPLLWLGLLGFCGVLWGSFLRNKEARSAS